MKHIVNLSIKTYPPKKCSRLVLFLSLAWMTCLYFISPATVVEARETPETVTHAVLNMDRYFVQVDAPSLNYQTCPDGTGRFYTETAKYHLYDIYNKNDRSDKYFCIMPLTTIQGDMSSPQAYEPAEFIKKIYKSRVPESTANQLSRDSYFMYGCLPPSERTRDRAMATQVRLWKNVGMSVSGDEFDWYSDEFREASARRHAWENSDSALQGQTYTLAAGESLTLNDDHGILQSLLYPAGFEPGQVQPIGGENSHLTAVWTWPNQLTIYADEEFKRTCQVDIAGGGDSTQTCYFDHINQGIISPEERLPWRSVSFAVEPETQYGSLKISKTGPQILRWQEASDFQQEKLYEPVWENLGLPGVEFHLISNETINIGGQEYAAGDLVYTLLTDDAGEALLEDIPCAQYVLLEVSEDPHYKNLSEGIPLTIVPDDEPVEAMAPFEVYNEKRSLSLSAYKVLQDTDTLSFAEVNQCLDDIRFVLRSRQDLPAHENTLPAGSLVAAAALTKVGEPNQAVELQESKSEVWTTFTMEIPDFGSYSLEEWNPHEKFLPFEPLQLDLTDPSRLSVTANGDYSVALVRPLVNQVRPKPQEQPSYDPPVIRSEQPTLPTVEWTPIPPRPLPAEPTSPPLYEAPPVTRQALIQQLPKTGQRGSWLSLTIGSAGMILLALRKKFL